MADVLNCVGGVCGTGEWSGPKPGDPDNNVTISATAEYGGIAVSWSYPSNYPHAVAHTLLFRATKDEFSLAIQQGIVAGNHYFDRISDIDSAEYFYWIKLVSVNGTVGAVVGPASATPKSFREQVIGAISGEIDDGVLAQSLRTQIEHITHVERSVEEEIAARLARDAILADAFAAVQAENGEAATYIRDEIIERKSANEAFLDSLNALAVGMAGNTGAITEEKLLRATKDGVLAEQINNVIATTANSLAAVRTDITAEATKTTALTSTVSLHTAKINGVEAAVQQETSARVAADNATAQNITTVQSALGNNIASVQTGLQTNIKAVGDKTNAIGALWTAKVDVNGMIGGFGVYNNGQFVEAGFDVDRFWIGRTNNKVKPFVIDNGTVYINKAQIRNADIDTLKIAGNAVTVPAGFYGTDVWFDFLGGGMLVTFVGSFIEGKEDFVNFDMYVNGAHVARQNVGLYVSGGHTGTIAMSVSLVHMSNTPTGVAHIQVVANSSWTGAAYGIADPKIVCMALRR